MSKEAGDSMPIHDRKRSSNRKSMRSSITNNVPIALERRMPAPLQTLMDVSSFEAMLEHAGILGGSLTGETLRYIFIGLRQTEQGPMEERPGFAALDDSDDECNSEHDEDDDDGDASSRGSFSSTRSSICSNKRSSRKEQRGTQQDLPRLAFNEFIDALVAVVLYKDPNPFLPFLVRFEHLILDGLLRPLSAYWEALSSEAGLGKNLRMLIDNHDEHVAKVAKAKEDANSNRPNSAEEESEL